MVLTNFLVILLMISVGFASAENSEPLTSNSTAGNESGAITNTTTTETETTNSTAPIAATDSNFTVVPAPKENESPEYHCVAVNFTLQLNDNRATSEPYTISTFDKIKMGWACGESNQSATIPWGKGSRISFHFERAVQTNIYILSNISLTVDAIDNVNSTVDETMSYRPSKGDFETPVGQSYNCIRSETLQGNKSKAIITILRFEAFRNVDATVFSSPVNCTKKTTPIVATEASTGSTVAIAVACSLLVLIVVLVVAYVIWRKRDNLSISGACT